MIHFFIKQIIISFFTLLYNSFFIIYQFCNMYYISINKTKILMTLTPGYKLLIIVFFQIIITYTNFEILSNIILTKEVLFRIIEEKPEISFEEILKEQKEKNTFQNDPFLFLRKFILKLLLSYFLIILFDFSFDRGPETLV